MDNSLDFRRYNGENSIETLDGMPLEKTVTDANIVIIPDRDNVLFLGSIKIAT